MPTNTATAPAGLPIALTPLSGEEAPRTILVKFHFTNERLVPPHIQLKQKLSRAAREIVRKESGMEKGEEVIHNLPDTSVADLRQELELHGFILVDVHYTREDRDKKKPKFVLTASFEKRDEEVPASFPEDTIAALNEITATTWEFAHVWWHKNKVDAVVLVGRRPERKPQHAIVAIEDALQAVVV